MGEQHIISTLSFDTMFRLFCDTRGLNLPAIKLSLHGVTNNIQGLLGILHRIKVGAIDAAALGPFKKQTHGHG